MDHSSPFISTDKEDYNALTHTHCRLLFKIVTLPPTHHALCKQKQSAENSDIEHTSEATKNREVLPEIVAIHPRETEFNILDEAVPTYRLSTLKENTDVHHLEEELNIVKKERDELLKEKEAMNEAMKNLNKEMQTLVTRTSDACPPLDSSPAQDVQPILYK
ncbi:hypothetical protein Pmani_010999 [Petrolisthes manimaculis]|uniref:Uncharacterized protein n=1 Tax=Petrolisthes manimaculis TaxID=1843537 RepID=A0AAE1UC15_9EUCA|nr:hypothetical protein Pmani_010999 [Petrolisthes manimaculis]